MEVELLICLVKTATSDDITADDEASKDLTEDNAKVL